MYKKLLNLKEEIKQYNKNIKNYCLKKINQLKKELKLPDSRNKKK